MFLKPEDFTSLKNELYSLITKKQNLKLNYKKGIITKKTFKQNDVLFHNQINTIKTKLKNHNDLFEFLKPDNVYESLLHHLKN